MVWWEDTSDQNKDLHLKELHAWCQAITGTHYSFDKQETLVYLDVDESHYEKWGETIPGASEEALVECIRKNMGTKEKDLFQSFVILINKWEAGVSDGTALDKNGLPVPPPVLPLLATWSIAAENMKADEKFAANNFYGQVERLYSLEKVSKDDLTHSYTKRDEKCWSVLNGWLEQCQGLRGLPTAYTSSVLKHVGLARSQALIRDQDRVVLHRMFASKGFSAHQAIPIDDMERLLKQWLNAPDGPSRNLLTAFKSDQSTISELVVEELKVWDGTGETTKNDSNNFVQRLELIASISTFPSKKLVLSLSIPGNENDAVFIETKKNDELKKEKLDFGRMDKGRLELLTPIKNFDSIVGGIVNLRNETRDIHRRPRSIVPFRYDVLTAKYIENERVSLGEKCILLCRKNLSDQCETQLSRIAQEGFKRENEITGLPTGWVLFSEVRVLRHGVDPNLLDKDKNTVWDALVPDVSSSISLEGGFFLPGTGRNIWSLYLQPNLLVSNDKGTSQRIRISQTYSSTNQLLPPIEEVTDQPTWGVNLSKYELTAGYYKVESFEGKKRTYFATSRFQLQDADDPVSVVPVTYNFGHSNEDTATSVFGSKRQQDDELFSVCGAFLNSSSDIKASVDLNDFVPNWWKNSAHNPIEEEIDDLGIILGDTDYPDCVETGIHKWRGVDPPPEIELYGRNAGMPKKSKTPTIWTCVHCSRRNIGNKFGDRKNASNLVSPTFDSADLTGLEGSREKQDLFNAAFDALSYKQQGSWADINQVASQVGSSPIEIHNFWRAFVALGHLEVTRNHLMEPEYWAVTPPVLAGVANGRYVLTGFRCKKLVDELQRIVKETGGVFSKKSQIYEESRGGPDLIYVEEMDEEQLRHIAEEVSKVLPKNIPKLTVQPNIGLRLAHVLPKLRDAIKNCPSENMPPVFGDVSKYNPTMDRYEDVGAATVSGCYRFSSYSHMYAIRTQEDIDIAHRRRVDAYIMKYAAALLEECSLLGYVATENKLYVPIGADLPGLYGRVAVLSSGRLPQIEHYDNQKAALVYSDVSPQIARLLFDKLNS